MHVHPFMVNLATEPGFKFTYIASAANPPGNGSSIPLPIDLFHRRIWIVATPTFNTRFVGKIRVQPQPNY